MTIASFLTLYLAECWVIVINLARISSDISYNMYLYYKPCITSTNNKMSIIDCYRSTSIMIRDTLEKKSLQIQENANFLYLIPGVLLGLIYGSWSDASGRRKPMASISVGLLLFICLISVDLELVKGRDYGLLLLIRFCCSLSSHYVIISTIAFSYVSDMSKQIHRMGRFILLDNLFRLTALIAAILWFFMDFAGITILCMASANLAMAAMIIAAFRNESSPLYEEKDDPSMVSVRRQLYNVLANAKDVFKVFTKKRDYHARVHIPILILLYAWNDLLQVCVVEITTVLAMSNKDMQWDVITVGNFRFLNEVALMTGGLLGWNLLRHFEALQEPWFIMLGLGFRSLQLIPVLATEPANEPYMYVGLFSILTALNGPAILCHLTQAIDADESATVFGATFGLSCLFHCLIEGFGKSIVFQNAQKPPNVVWGPILAMSALLFLIMGLFMRDMTKQFERRQRHYLIALGECPNEPCSEGRNTPCVNPCVEEPFKKDGEEVNVDFYKLQNMQEIKTAFRSAAKPQPKAKKTNQFDTDTLAASIDDNAYTPKTMPMKTIQKVANTEPSTTVKPNVNIGAGKTIPSEISQPSKPASNQNADTDKITTTIPNIGKQDDLISVENSEIENTTNKNTEEKTRKQSSGKKVSEIGSKAVADNKSKKHLKSSQGKNDKKRHSPHRSIDANNYSQDTRAPATLSEDLRNNNDDEDALAHHKRYHAYPVLMKSRSISLSTSVSPIHSEIIEKDKLYSINTTYNEHKVLHVQHDDNQISDTSTSSNSSQSSETSTDTITKRNKLHHK